MTKNLSTLFGAVCLFLALASRSVGQAPSPAAPDDAALRRIVEHLEQQDEAMRKSITEFLSVLESELAAGRISETIADGLHAAARESLPPIFGDARVLFADARIPAGNEPVMRALKSVEATALETQVQRSSLMSEALVDARERARQIAFGARNSSDVEPFIAAVTRLKAVALAHCAFGGTCATLETFKGLEKFARALSPALDPDLKDPAVVGAELDSEYNIAGMEDVGLHGNEQLGRFKSRLLAPWNAAVEKELWSLLAALSQRKSLAEVDEALRRADEAGKRLSSIFASNHWNGVSPIFLEMSAIEASLEKPGASWDDSRIADLIRKIDFDRSSPPEQRALFSEAKRILLEWQKQRQDLARASARPAGVMRLLEQLKGVRQASDLDALVADPDTRLLAVGARKVDGVQRTNAEVLSLLGRFRSAASTADFSELTELHRMAEGSIDPEVEAALGDLRHRLVREVLGRELRAPELSRAPLADQPLDTALDEVCRSMAAAGQWQRVAEILELRNSRRFASDLRPAEEEALPSVRLFLAGQNFELAELWADAASAYKTVLRSATEDALIKEAAEKLKALKRSHPDAAASHR